MKNAVLTGSSVFTGTPIGGVILTSSSDKYWGIITFTILSYLASCACLIAAKISCRGWGGIFGVF